MRKLVVTPMKEEQALFLQSCQNRTFAASRADAGLLTVYDIPGLNLLLSVGGTGKVQFAVQTQHLLDNLPRPDIVICAGAAGALGDDLKVGDVVVATMTIEHDVREKFLARDLPRFAASQDLIRTLQLVEYDRSAFRVHFGPVASGDEDVVDHRRKLELQQATGAVAVAWEGAGGAKACRFSGVPFLEVRGITDTADESAAADFEQNLTTAMDNIVSFIISWGKRSPKG